MPAFKKAKGDAKLTKELIKELCMYFELGSFIETALAMCHVDKKRFYKWIKESYEDGRSTKHKKLCIELRNAVRQSFAKATMRDLKNIEKCAMGRKPEFDRYPKGTVIPARNDKGEVQFNKHTGEPFMIDVSGQIICDYKGRPIIADKGIAPDWHASKWRLEKRSGKLWGNDDINAEPKEKPVEIDNKEEDQNTMNIVFIKPEVE